MLTQKRFLLFTSLLFIAAISPDPVAVQAFHASTLRKNGYAKRTDYYSSLGLVCKCCDGEGGNCRSTTEAACSNLRCHPWKY